jgi:hypothetical protein
MLKEKAMRQTAMLAALATMVLACGSADAHPPVRVDVGRVGGLPYGMYVEVLDQYGSPLETGYSGGRKYVLGEHGGRYTIRVANPSSRRVEVVVSVDGLDVIDGKAASFGKRGYVINPYGDVRIEGWRTSFSSVAAFRFGRVADSYAARTGSARNVGVIGVAVFTEREPVISRPLIPRHRHYYGDEDYLGRRDGAGTAPEAKARKAPAKPSAAPPATAKAPSADKSAPSGGAGRAESESSAQAYRGYRRYIPQERPGLGTEFGEQRGSQVQLTTFVRLSSRPAGYAELRYNDEGGLARLGIHFHSHHYVDDDDLWQRETANPFPAGRSFAAPPPPRQWE